MTALLRCLGVVMLLGSSVRAAEHDWPASPRAKAAEVRVALAVSQRAGLVEAPFVTTAFPEVSGFGMVLTGTAAVRISGLGWLQLKLPVSLAWLDYPGGTQLSEAALGNLELGLEHPLELRPSTRLGLLAALFVPSAEHGSQTALLNNRALALGSALNAGKDSALLTPGVTGLRLGVSVEHSWRPFEFQASLDLPLLVRLSDASLPADALTHPVGILPALDLRAAWWITSRFGASLGAGLVMELERVQEPALESERERRVQAVVEPGLHLLLGRRVALGLDASLPVGGNLGGDAWSVGAQVRVEL